MNRLSVYIHLTILACVSLTVWASPAWAEAASDQDANAPTAEGRAEMQQEAGDDIGLLPHVRVDRENRMVELDAKVVARDGDWLELLACMPGTREHETILTVPAKPSHVHLALLLIGLKPGHPLRWEREGDRLTVIPPTGDRVTVHVLVPPSDPEDPEAMPREVPAHFWVRPAGDGPGLSDNIWLFTGSRFVEHRGKRIYAADQDGTVISLVNFGDDLLARPTEVTNRSDDGMWKVRTDAVPPLETEIKIRIRPAPEPLDDSDEHANEGASN